MVVISTCFFITGRSHDIFFMIQISSNSYGSTPINILIYMVNWHLASPSLTTSQESACCKGDEGNAMNFDGLALSPPPPSLGERRTAKEV